MNKFKILLAALAAFHVTASALAQDWVLTLPNGAEENALGTITDGNWTLNVFVTNAVNKTLCLGSEPFPHADPSTYPRGNAFVYTDGIPVGSGVLDLRGSVKKASGEAWTIVGFGYRAFSGVGGYGASYSPCTKLYLPTTLANLGLYEYQSFGGFGGYRSPELFYVSSEYLISGMYNNTFINAGVTNLVLKAPNLTWIGGFDFNEKFLSGTDVTDWDLSSVERIGVNNKTDWTADSYLDEKTVRTFFRGKSFTGTLSLPSMTVANKRMLEGCVNLGGLVLGTNGTLAEVQSNIVAGCSSLTNLTIGSAASLTIHPTAFSAPNLQQVTLSMGKMPTFKAGAPAFGTASTAALSIVFVVPESLATNSSWKVSKLNVRAVKKSERSAYAAEHGQAAADRLTGVAMASVFNTAREQFVAEILPVRVSAQVYDARYADDTVTVTVDGQPHAGGEIAKGATVNLTASSTGAGTFAYWLGLPGGITNAASVSVKADSSFAAYAVFHHPWTFVCNTDDANPATGTRGYLTNEFWKLNVTVDNQKNKQLCIGDRNTNLVESAWTTTGDGILDLNGTVVRQGFDDQTWTIVNFAKWSMQYDKKSTAGNRYPSALIFPETLTVAGSQPVRYLTCSEMIVICPQLTQEFGQDYFDGLNLTRFVIRAPLQTTLKAQAALKLSESVRADDFDLSGVTVNAAGASGADLLRYPAFFATRNLSGTLRLPSVSDVSTEAFKAMPNLDGIVLGGNATLASIGARAFSNCTMLASLTLNSGSDLTVAEDAFANASGLKDIYFSGVPPSPAALDSILLAVPSTSGFKQCSIHVKKASQWKSLMSPLTAEERLARPELDEPLSVLGVYQTTGGERKAWIVGEAPKGLLLFVR